MYVSISWYKLEPSCPPYCAIYKWVFTLVDSHVQGLPIICEHIIMSGIFSFNAFNVISRVHFICIIFWVSGKMWHFLHIWFDPGSPMKTERLTLCSKTSLRWVWHGTNPNQWINFCTNAIRRGGPLLAVVVSLMWVTTIAANNQVVQRPYAI